MFALSEYDQKKSILGCGDGPASFNAELTAAGGTVTSVDPIYQFTAEQVSERIERVSHDVLDQMKRNSDRYVWEKIKDIEHLAMVRMKAMHTFLADFSIGVNEGRYINASLPDLPFTDHRFDLALCSHFLFLYSQQIDLAQHLAGMKELCRISREVRVYPLTALDGNVSPYLTPVCEALTDMGMLVVRVPVEYQFQKGATDMLVVKNSM